MVTTMNAENRPLSVATVTSASDAPPPYSEYDNSIAPPPDEATQAMLRGGYLVARQRSHQPQSQQPGSSSPREYGPATAYMRGRPYSERHDNQITVARAIHPSIRADGFPFPSEYPAVSLRDVTPHDWSYFTSCILKDLEVPNVKGAVATPVTINEFRERQDMVDATIEQWNRGFFAPRGIHVVPAYSFYRAAPATEEVARSNSPTPTYATEQTMNRDDEEEVMTVTIDTSPRSSRAGTPDTIRDLNNDGEVVAVKLTPGTADGHEVDASLHHSNVRQNSIPRKPIPSQLESSDLPSRTRGLPKQARPIATKYEKGRRDSTSSASLSSLSSLGSISSNDALANGDVPAIRRTLAQEFARDPKTRTHLKAALAQIRSDIAAQQKATLSATRSQRAELHAAARHHRKMMRGEMKELSHEIASYQRSYKTSQKQQRNERKSLRQERKKAAKEAKQQADQLRKEHKHLRKELRGGRRRTDPVPTAIPPQDTSSDKPQMREVPRPGPTPLRGPNLSTPHLGGSGLPAAGSPSDLTGDGPHPGTWSPSQPGTPRAMSTITFDETGASPQYGRCRSPVFSRLGNGRICAPSDNCFTSEANPIQQGREMVRERLANARKQGASALANSPLGNVVGNSPIGMARNFLLAQANASLERLRMADAPPVRVDEESYHRTSKPEGQETGVLRQ